MLCAVLTRLTGLVLVLLLAVSGQGLAQGRGDTAAVGQAVICTGTGPVVIYLDDQGQPTGPPRYCPDFAMHGFDLAASVPLASAPARRLTRLPWSFSYPFPPAQAAPAAMARGPPRLV